MGNNYQARIDNLLAEFTYGKEYRSNRQYCIGFIKSAEARGLAPTTILKYLNRIKYISQVIPDKDFKAWTRQDVEMIMSKIRQEQKPWSVATFISFFKSFWRYIFNLSSQEIPPESVRWLQKSNPGNNLKKEDLLTRDEIKRMMTSTKNIEYKSIIAIFCAGARPSELISIKFSDIHDDGSIMKIYVKAKPVNGNKKHQRPIYPGFFIKENNHREIIRQWIREHPNGNTPDAKLFITSYGTIRVGLKRIAEKANIHKSFDLYRFRHTFGTWAYSHFNGAYARRLMGHAPGSRMEGVYCHLAEEDLEDVLAGRTPYEREMTVETQAEFETKFISFLNEKRDVLRNMFLEWERNTYN